MPVFVSHHILLRKRAAAGTELVPQHVEELDIEIGGLIGRAVKRPDVTGCRSTPGLDRPGEQLHPRPGVVRHQLLPHAVHRVTRCHHAALHDPVRVLARLTLAQVEARRRDALRAADLPLLRHHHAGVDAEKQRDHDDDQSAEATADRDAAATAATAAGRRGAGVDLHAFVEGHRIASKHSPDLSGTQVPSALHTTIYTWQSLSDIRPSCTRVWAIFAARRRAVSPCGAACPTPSNLSASAGFWHPRRCSRGPVCAMPSNTDRSRRKASRSSAAAAMIRRFATKHV